MYCHHCEKTFITLEHVITTPRGAQLALMIEQGRHLRISESHYFLTALDLAVNC